MDINKDRPDLRPTLLSEGPQLVKLGSAVVAAFQKIGGVELDIERDRTPVEPPSFD